MKLVSLLLLSYVLGSISFAYLVAYSITGKDIKSLGDGNPGAANVARVLGRKWGLLTWAGDVTKTLLALTVARSAGIENLTLLTLVGIAAILGHCYSVFLRFKGGRGVAVMGGVVLFLMPKLFLLALILWFLIQKLNPRCLTLVVQGLVIFLLCLFLLYGKELFPILTGCVLLLVATALIINHDVLREMKI